MTYNTQGVCSRTIDFEIQDGKVYNVRYQGGCNGNQKGIGVLVEGLPIEDVIQRLEGIRCGNRPTSCPAQLAQALKQANV